MVVYQIQYKSWLNNFVGSMSILKSSLNIVTKNTLRQTSRCFSPTQEHVSLKENLIKLIEKEINPYCDKWDQEKAFPAHKVFKILGGFASVTDR